MRSRFANSGAAAWRTAVFAACCPACASSTDGQSSPAVPAVCVQDALAKPSPLAVVAVARAADEGLKFDISNALHTATPSQPLHYYWFYDYAASGTLNQFKICGNEPRCSLFVCNFTKFDQPNHTLSVVVANQPLPMTAASPTDFPAGAVFDSVQWSLALDGNCSGQ